MFVQCMAHTYPGEAERDRSEAQIDSFFNDGKDKTDSGYICSAKVDATITGDAVRRV